MTNTRVKFSEPHRKQAVRSARYGFWLAVLELLKSALSVIAVLIVVGLIIIIAKTPA